MASLIIEDIMKEAATTAISFEKKLSDISNFKSLPDEVQKLILSAYKMESRGFQELVGYKLIGYNGRQAVWSAVGHWSGSGDDATFTVNSIGGKLDGKNIQWSEREEFKSRNSPAKAKITVRLELPSGQSILGKIKENIRLLEKEFKSAYEHNPDKLDELIKSIEKRFRDTVSTLAEKTDLIVNIDGKDYWKK